VPITEFFLGPGKTAVKPGEFLLRIEIPPAPNMGALSQTGRNAIGDCPL
jgi:CO/xanthine dehydrogenase FAD-binding subunit